MDNRRNYVVGNPNQTLSIFQATTSIHVGLLIFEDFPLYLNALGLVQQALHGFLLKDFPVVRVTSITFVTALVTLVVHHYMAFKFFGTVYYTFSEVRLLFLNTFLLVL